MTPTRFSNRAIPALPTEIINQIFLYLPFRHLCLIHKDAPDLRPITTTILDQHIQSLTLTLSAYYGQSKIPLRCDKTLSTPRYLYYFRPFSDKFHSGRFPNKGSGVSLSFTDPREDWELCMYFTGCHLHIKSCYSEEWHTTLLKLESPIQSEPTRYEHRYCPENTEVHFSVLLCHLNWIVNCFLNVDDGETVDLVLEEGVQSMFMRRMMERVEEEEGKAESA